MAVDANIDFIKVVNGILDETMEDGLPQVKSVKYLAKRIGLIYQLVGYSTSVPVFNNGKITVEINLDTRRIKQDIEELIKDIKAGKV